jgi:hypothetical protein
MPNVSEEHSTSIFRVEEQASKKQTAELASCFSWFLVSVMKLELFIRNKPEANTNHRDSYLLECIAV